MNLWITAQNLIIINNSISKPLSLPSVELCLKLGLCLALYFVEYSSTFMICLSNVSQADYMYITRTIYTIFDSRPDAGTLGLPSEYNLVSNFKLTPRRHSIFRAMLFETMNMFILIKNWQYSGLTAPLDPRSHESQVQRMPKLYSLKLISTYNVDNRSYTHTDNRWIIFRFSGI